MRLSRSLVIRVMRRPAFSREKKSIDSRWKWLNTLHAQVVEQPLADPARSTRSGCGW